MARAVRVKVGLKSGREVRLLMTPSTLDLLHQLVEQKESKSKWGKGFTAAEVEYIEEVQ